MSKSYNWSVVWTDVVMPPGVVLTHQCGEYAVRPNGNHGHMASCREGEWSCIRCRANPPEEIAFMAELAGCNSNLDWYPIPNK